MYIFETLANGNILFTIDHYWSLRFAINDKNK